MIDIFEYNDYQSYLRAWLDRENERRLAAGRARLTHRRMVELMGASSSGTLVHVLTGARPLTEALAQKLRLLMGHDEDEHAWLLILIRLERARATCERAQGALKAAEDELRGAHDSGRAGTIRLERQVDHRRAALDDARAELASVELGMATARARQAVRLMDRRRLQIVSDWLTLAILELARCEGFQADPLWISQALRCVASRAQVEDALDALAALGYRLEPGGALPGALRTKPLVEARAVRGYYLSLIERVVAALREHVEPLHLEYQSRSRLGAVTVAVPSAGLPVLHEAMARAQEDLLALAEGMQGPRDMVLQVYLHLFPLSERTSASVPRGE